MNESHKLLSDDFSYAWESLPSAVQEALNEDWSLIEEQAARVATLEQERDDAIVRFLKQEDRAEASEARLSEAVKVLERLAEGEMSDTGHTALREAAKAFIATLGEAK